ERDVRYANITIIEGHDASQYGIGIVSARIAEMVLNDERAVVPIGSYQKKFGVTLSLPSIVGRRGVIEVLEPEMSDEEREGLRKRRGRRGGGAGSRPQATESKGGGFEWRLPTAPLVDTECTGGVPCQLSPPRPCYLVSA